MANTEPSHVELGLDTFGDVTRDETGALLSDSRRHSLLGWAARHGAWLLEDDYDGEFHFGSAPAQTLHALDGGRSVIHVGTFSKRVFPALRLGYLIAPRAFS